MVVLFSEISSMNNKHEKRHFALERVEGYDKYTFIHFITTVKIYSGGRYFNTQPDALIIIPPYTYHAYIVENETLIHDYVHFQLNEPSFFESLELPIDRVFYVDNYDEMSTVIADITYFNTPDLKKADVEFDKKSSDLLEGLFWGIAKQDISLHDNGDRRKHLFRRLNRIRDKVRQEPGAWSVQKMADAANYSRTRFSVLYMSLFGITPQDEIVNASMEMVKHMLSATDMPVNEIAIRCGYESASYLNRLFKKREGITPGLYRKQLL